MFRIISMLGFPIGFAIWRPGEGTVNVDSVAERFRSDFDEMWEIVAAVRVERRETVYRIEVVRNLRDTSPQFSVHYFSRSGKAWRTDDFGAVFAKTPKSALAQGLGFIRSSTGDKA